ncbi:Pyruvate:ferredoxin oxidoreductase or related 2-oxoacid:ferredoxin oxidoreductase, gamma subunit [Halalkaliarchaeum sp. AArc-CO]|uniref:pyruvate ferredoxin oxidoreductase subunit gamma n=1 Tax=unclassified Halalkaliarchaeum TaxID=2678344 RepID=UPI00217F0A75|nr:MULTISPECIES: pyruvate ferredoxin oxidoreductase subunit gamma [unclassified Halalkaliarchaeum]MDR5673062.1 pyruvate ferredoxin oxidoreductase subunit gamma [Halalkaliarchaeum sp. AArc-GB]UWG49537.1 Pyruvate:ferredoxin oxidoreductase or related 2-oxoacid:ferredoxin oxidoreductase, gamma subunit [Halalkaliarchaeum sp. AArc-CO]
MEQIRIHGRGGQGSVTLAHLIAEAAFEQGDWAQAFPAFGVERRGAPVEAFARIDAEKITDRSQVNEPTYVLVQDPTLVDIVDVAEGLIEDGTVVVNSTAEPAELSIPTDERIVTVDATGIAREHLGRPIMNTSLLGAFAGATGVLEIDSIESVTVSTFGGDIGRKNAAAADAAFREVAAV